MNITPEQEALVRFVLETEGSINRGRVQRTLKIGWFAATDLMDQLVNRGMAVPYTDANGQLTYFPPVPPQTENGWT